MLISDGSLTTDSKHMLRAWIIALFTAILSLTGACYDGDKHMCPRDFGDGRLGPNDSDAGFSNQPPRGWSVALPLTCLNPTAFASLQADFDEPDLYTVQFGLFDIDGQPNPVIPRVIYTEAIIEWSVAGNTVTRRITVSDGMSISGVGEGVRVRAIDGTIDISMIGVRYGVTITVAKGQRASQTPPSLSAYGPQGSFNVTAGNSFNTPIPRGAGINSVQVSVANTFTGAVIPDQGCIVSQSATNGGNQLKACDARQFEWIPIAAGATDVTILNNTAVQFVVTLYWGIDG